MQQHLRTHRKVPVASDGNVELETVILNSMPGRWESSCGPNSYAPNSNADIQLRNSVRS